MMGITGLNGVNDVGKQKYGDEGVFNERWMLRMSQKTWHQLMQFLKKKKTSWSCDAVVVVCGPWNTPRGEHYKEEASYHLFVYNIICIVLLNTYLWSKIYPHLKSCYCYYCTILVWYRRDTIMDRAQSRIEVLGRHLSTSDTQNLTAVPTGT